MATSTVTSASGQETSKSSRRDACASVSSSPIYRYIACAGTGSAPPAAGTEPLSSADAIARARALSVITCLARRRSTGSPAGRPRGGRCTAPRDGTPSSRAASSHSARRAAYSPDTRACVTRVSMISAAVPAAAGRNGTWVTVERPAVEQHRVALLAQQRRGLVDDPGRRADELVLRPLGDRRPASGAAPSRRTASKAPAPPSTPARRTTTRPRRPAGRSRRRSRRRATAMPGRAQRPRHARRVGGPAASPRRASSESSATVTGSSGTCLDRSTSSPSPAAPGPAARRHAPGRARTAARSPSL